jgi:hypothetical protein
MAFKKNQLLNKTFFVFGSTCRIFVSVEYSADNFRPNTRPKTFSVDHYCSDNIISASQRSFLTQFSGNF